MYLVVSISTSPKTDFCVCHVCTLLKQSSDMNEEVLEEVVLYGFSPPW